MTRDEAAALLRGRRCWEDQDLSLVRDDSDAALVGPAPDIILQQRDELLDLVGFMNEDNARSLLEVGTWTGRTVEYLSVAVPGLSRVAVVDTLEACRLGLPLHLPPGTQLLVDSSTSATATLNVERIAFAYALLEDALRRAVGYNPRARRGGRAVDRPGLENQ